MKQCYAAIAIGIVFDTCNSGRYTILPALEVNDAVALFVATSTVTEVFRPLLFRPPVECFLASRDFSGRSVWFTEVRDGLETSTRTGRLAYALP